MRRLALCLFWIALAKVTLVEHLQRAGMTDALMSAHERTALNACARIAPGLGADATVKVVTGDRSRAVALWEVDHHDWARRYRQTNLVVTPAAGTRISCRYDIAAGTAVLSGP